MLKELLDKLPTLKPVASTVETSQHHSSEEEPSQSDTDSSTATLQKISSLENTDSSEENATQANTALTSVNEKPNQFDEQVLVHSSAESVSVRDVIDDSNDVSCTRVGEQFVSDNIDIQMTSLYGLRSIHAMGRIMVTPESSYHATETEIERVQVPTREKEDLLQNLEIKIQPFYHKNYNGFTSVSFIPIGILMQRFNMIVTSCPGDTAWLLGWVSKQKLNPMLKHPSWKGFMKSIHNESGIGEVGHRVPANRDQPANHKCSPRQFQYHIYDHNRVPEIIHRSAHDDNLRFAIVE